MTQAIRYYDDRDGSAAHGAAVDYIDQVAPPINPVTGLPYTLADTAYIPRARWLSLPFLFPLALCAVSYAAGGQPFLTDLGFVVLALVCFFCMIRELVVFPARFGVGGLLIFCGVLIWFCHDYFSNWFNINFTGAVVEPWVVAKAAYYHCLFILFMVLGLQIKKGRWLERVLHAVPEPRSRSIYFMLVLVTFAIGMIPFLFFTKEPFYIAIWQSFWGGRGGGAEFTAGRTGNLNYSWGGYIAQLADVGMLGAVLAAFNAIVVTRQLWQQLLCWAIWLLWLFVAFGTGTRGFTVFLTLPVIMLVFLKYSHQASTLMRRISMRAYVVTGVVAFFVLVLVQVQGAFRNEGFTAEQFKEVEVTELKGNEMFTTSLAGMELIPRDRPFFLNTFPGEGIVRPIPEELFWLVTGPIPRALWTTKPVSEVQSWYNDTVTGENKGMEGTTISHGAVGHPYIRFGWAGVVEFGLFYGWAIGVAERALRRAMGRPMHILFTLGFCTFMFRSFRDLWWHNLYPLVVAGAVMAVVVWFSNAFFGGSEEYGPAAPAGA
jgi:hypothetical protein